MSMLTSEPSLCDGCDGDGAGVFTSGLHVHFAATMAEHTSSESELAVSDSDPDELLAFPTFATNSAQLPPAAQPSSSALDDQTPKPSQNHEPDVPTRLSTANEGETDAGISHPTHPARLASSRRETDEYSLNQLVVNVNRTDMFKSMPKMTRPCVSVTAIDAESSAILNQLDAAAHRINTQTLPVRLQHTTVVQPVWNTPLHLPVQWPFLSTHNDHNVSAPSAAIVLLFKLFDELPAPKTRRQAFNSSHNQASQHVHALAFLKLTPTASHASAEHKYIDKDLRLQWYSVHSMRKQLKHHPHPEIFWYQQHAKGGAKLKFSLHLHLTVKRLLVAPLQGPHSPSATSNVSQADVTE